MKFTAMTTTRISSVASARFGAWLALTFTLAGTSSLWADTEPYWLGHDRTRPLPAVVDPGQPSREAQVGKAPSDAVVLFDGADLSKWVAMDGKPTKWVVKDGAMECVPGSGRRPHAASASATASCTSSSPPRHRRTATARAAATAASSSWPYELQVLDSYKNTTYADGSAARSTASIPPLVNASRPPGEWQTYDIIWMPPRFDAAGKLLSPARDDRLPQRRAHPEQRRR